MAFSRLALCMEQGEGLTEVEAVAGRPARGTRLRATAAGRWMFQVQEPTNEDAGRIKTLFKPLLRGGRGPPQGGGSASREPLRRESVSSRRSVYAPRHSPSPTRREANDLRARPSTAERNRLCWPRPAPAPTAQRGFPGGARGRCPRTASRRDVVDCPSQLRTTARLV